VVVFILLSSFKVDLLNKGKLFTFYLFLCCVCLPVEACSASQCVSRCSWWKECQMNSVLFIVFVVPNHHRAHGARFIKQKT
jgi:hypothetical protein